MARSLGLAAYRVFSQRLPATAVTRTGSRPKGEVLWLHAATADRVPALCELGKRVQNQRDDLVVLITSNTELPDAPAPLRPNETSTLYDRLTSDRVDETLEFLDHWRPDICIWAGAGLMPNLISHISGRNIPMIMIDVGQDDFSSRNYKWFPDLTRESLGRFEAIVTTGPGVLATLRRIGVPSQILTVGEPLSNGPSPDVVAEENLSSTSQQLVGRPLWLASQVQLGEFETILAAHRFAVKLIHRLLLVVTVADPDTLARLSDALKGAGMRHAHWYVGDDIDDNTQVLISDGTDDQGLWYRMAPLTFMASSLNIEDKGRSPLEAIALGSAVLFGPHVADHKDTYTRLTTVGAGHRVDDADSLGEAVIRLIAPDRAASMALKGWEVVTQGAALTDHLVDLIQDHLDRAVINRARA